MTFTLKSSIDNSSTIQNVSSFKSFVHEESRLTVNLANVSGPLYSLAVVVPTFLQDDKGKAHTLEHLIFTGSEKYPKRGYLDKLATSCLSNGTNAYTADDHTAYTFSCASAAGLLGLLLVFLDHILNPLIKAETVAMEVFSLKHDRTEGISGQGVVYCEMKARQNSEADLLDLNLRREFYNTHGHANPSMSLYKWECGGLTGEIAKLSMDEIIEFHQKFYSPSNMNIVISGSICAEMQSEILAKIDQAFSQKPFERAPPRQTDFLSTECHSMKIAAPSGSRTVHFPSTDESLGSVGLAWPGVVSKDLKTILAYHVLFKCLRGPSSAPLNQKFVQIQNPWATDIDYEIKPFHQTIMSLLFSGVPTGHEALTQGAVKSKLKSVLDGLLDDLEELSEIIRLNLISFEMKLIEFFEDDPHEVILSYTLPTIIAARIDSTDPEPFGSNICRLSDLISQLKTEPLPFWIEMIKYLSSSDPIEIIMIPDSFLNSQIESQERQYLQELWDSKSPKEKSALEMISAEAKIEENSDDQFPLVKASPLIPFVRVAPQLGGAHLIEFPNSGLKMMMKATNFKRVVPSHLWRYLVIFQELLFQTDVDFSNEAEILKILNWKESTPIVSYQFLQKALSSIMNSYGVYFGVDNEVFSLGCCEDAMILSLILPADSLISIETCHDILQAVVANSIIDKSRVKIVAENLFNQIQDLQKDPYEVIDAILTRELHDMSIESRKSECPSFESEISMFNQKGILKGIFKDEELVDELVSILNEIKSSFASTLTGDCLMQIGGKPAILRNEFEEISLKTSFKGRELFDVNKLPRCGDYVLKEPRAIACPLGDVTASYLSYVIPCNVLPTDFDSPTVDCIKNYLSISLICQLLSVTEGPIYSRIRGKGLAYGASLSLSLWNGLLSFGVNDSNDPASAYGEFLSLLGQISDELSAFPSSSATSTIVNSNSLNVAKAALLYELIEERSTPSSFFTSIFRSYLRNVPLSSSEKESDPIMDLIQEISVFDLINAFRNHFLPFLDSKQAISILVAPRGQLHDVVEKFSGKIDFEVKNLCEFYSEEDDSGSECEDGTEDEDEDGDSTIDEGSASEDRDENIKKKQRI